MSILDTQLRHSGPATPRLRVAWAAMLALTTLAALAVLVTTPFSAEEGELIHALRSGEIQPVAVGHSADFYTASGVHTTGINVQDDIAVTGTCRHTTHFLRPSRDVFHASTSVSGTGGGCQVP